MPSFHDDLASGRFSIRPIDGSPPGHDRIFHMRLGGEFAFITAYKCDTSFLQLLLTFFFKFLRVSKQNHFIKCVTITIPFAIFH